MDTAPPGAHTQQNPGGALHPQNVEPTHPLGADQGYKKLHKILFRPRKTRTSRPPLVPQLHAPNRNLRPAARIPIPMAEGPLPGVTTTSRRSYHCMVLRPRRGFWKNGTFQVHTQEPTAHTLLLRGQIHRHLLPGHQGEIRSCRRIGQPPPEFGREGILRGHRGNQGRLTAIREVRRWLQDVPKPTRSNLCQLHARPGGTVARPLDHSPVKKQRTPLKDYVDPSTTWEDKENTPPTIDILDFTGWNETLALI